MCNQACPKYPEYQICNIFAICQGKWKEHQRFLQIDTINLGVVGHSQSTQNNKFSISLQYHKKKVSDEVDLLHAYKYESFLQIDNMIFDGDGQAFPEFPD